MKAALERLSKEGAEKDARIKCQEEHIAKLLKKLDKGLCASSGRGISSNEDPQNDSSLSSMTAEQIQKLIANAVKTQLRVGSQKSHLYRGLFIGLGLHRISLDQRPKVTIGKDRGPDQSYFSPDQKTRIERENLDRNKTGPIFYCFWTSFFVVIVSAI